jgi:hypothetical protein
VEAVAAVVPCGSHDEDAAAGAKVDRAKQSWVRSPRVPWLTGADVDHLGAVADGGFDCPGEVSLRTGEYGARVGRVIGEDRNHNAPAAWGDAPEWAHTMLAKDKAGHVRTVGAGGIAAGRAANALNDTQLRATKRGVREIDGTVEHGHNDRRIAQCATPDFGNPGEWILNGYALPG